MDRRRIGSLEVGVVGLGCNNFGARLDEAATRDVVHAALDAGITFFDTAALYGAGQSETFLGRALGKRRDDVVIATKFGYDDGARAARRSCEESLRRLGTDHIDLFQLHRPDPTTPVEDTLGTLNELISEGKVREIGCSQTEQIEGFRSVQNEYSLLHRKPELSPLPECRERGISFLPFFPLANGLLSGRYVRGAPPPAASRLATNASLAEHFLTPTNLELVDALHSFAISRGHTLLELAISWLLSEPVVSSVIAGAMTAEQVRANAAAACWTLTPADRAAVDLRTGGRAGS